MFQDCSLAQEKELFRSQSMSFDSGKYCGMKGSFLYELQQKDRQKKETPGSMQSSKQTIKK